VHKCCGAIPIALWVCAFCAPAHALQTVEWRGPAALAEIAGDVDLLPAGIPQFANTGSRGGLPEVFVSTVEQPRAMHTLLPAQVLRRLDTVPLDEPPRTNRATGHLTQLLAGLVMIGLVARRRLALR
jgi:hypothetical protein